MTLTSCLCLNILLCSSRRSRPRIVRRRSTRLV